MCHVSRVTLATTLTNHTGLHGASMGLPCLRNQEESPFENHDRFPSATRGAAAESSIQHVAHVICATCDSDAICGRGAVFLHQQHLVWLPPSVHGNVCTRVYYSPRFRRHRRPRCCPRSYVRQNNGSGHLNPQLQGAACTRSHAFPH